MKSFFEELFQYNQHCNQRLTDVFLQESAKVDTKSVDLFSHILNAHHIWNHRISGRKPEYGVWDNHAINAFATIDQGNHEDTWSILAACDLTNDIAYHTSTGHPFVNTVHDTLFHVINHSTYHRGQLALLFRQYGVEPLVTDYIRYKH